MLAPLLLCLLSCGAAKKDPARPAEKPKTFSERLNESNGFKQDEKGNWVPRNDKRSAFEMAGESPYFKGEYAKKEYRTEDYSKTPWWGKKDYAKPEWQGNTDASRFQKSAREQGGSALEAGTSSRMTGAYQTNEYATGAAREASQRGITRAVDAETQERRETYQAPEVINWREQRSMSREQTRSLLGR